MNYKKIYDEIIANAKQRGKLDAYQEKHHILPRCLRGSNHRDNLVFLTYKEHFICHRLLCKIYPYNYRLKASLARMMTKTKQSANKYAAAKRSLKDLKYPWLSESWKTPWNKGKKNVQVPWNKGISIGPASEDRKAKSSITLKERYKTKTHPRKGKPSWNSGQKGLQIPWNKGISEEKIPCDVCGLFANKGNIKRWHNSNCRNRKVLES